MIAVRIGPGIRMAVVGAPSYFRKRPEPKTPQEGPAQPHLAKGRLKRVLEDRCPPRPIRAILYYPSRRQSSAAFALLVDALRYRG